MMDNARFLAVVLLGLGLATGVTALAADDGGPTGRGAQATHAPCLSATGLAADAGARKPVEIPGEVMVLHATNTDGGIDPDLQRLPQLRKPPFSAYNTYRLVSRHAVVLGTARPDSTTTLPNGRVLKTTLKAVLPDARYRVAASISRPKSDKDDEGSFLPLLEVTARKGETFFVAGQSYRGGILVVGIRVGEEAKASERPRK
ncbi:MAG: hypothetical protein MUF54_16745 [Polyangiaceae bacterium]|jgi:hypothetical protein|nr:hypothetical protein [Polyangiaceae bacterium]